MTLQTSSDLINRKQGNPADASSLAAHGLADIGCAVPGGLRATTDLHPEMMAAMHPDLFRVTRPLPITTFAEQHATALAVVQRQPMRPAACQLMAELDAIACARKVAS